MVEHLVDTQPSTADATPSSTTPRTPARKQPARSCNAGPDAVPIEDCHLRKRSREDLNHQLPPQKRTAREPTLSLQLHEQLRLLISSTSRLDEVDDQEHPFRPPSPVLGPFQRAEKLANDACAELSAVESLPYGNVRSVSHTVGRTLDTASTTNLPGVESPDAAVVDGPSHEPASVPTFPQPGASGPSLPWVSRIQEPINDSAVIKTLEGLFAAGIFPSWETLAHEILLKHTDLTHWTRDIKANQDRSLPEYEGISEGLGPVVNAGGDVIPPVGRARKKTKMWQHSGIKPSTADGRQRHIEIY
jgi:hypothetical protein